MTARAIMGAVLAAMVGAADAQTVLDRRYTSVKLDGLWAGTLGTAPPPAALFSLLAPGGAAPAPVAAPADFGLPFTGVLMGETASPTGTATRAFPVIPLDDADAATLTRRLAWAEIYLSRYRFYAPVSTDDAAMLQALTARQYAAGLEAYLYSARLYFAAPDLPEKCRRLTRMRELGQGPLSGMTDAAVPQGWRALIPVQTATAARLGDDTLARLVCSVEPVRGRAATIELVETRVRERIITAVRAKVDETLTLLNARAVEFQGVVNDMDVTILSAEIIELERVLGNAASNMVMVKEDQLAAAATIATLQAIDLSSLNQPTELTEFQVGQTRMTAMQAEIETVMSAIADLAATVDDPAVSADLAPCDALRGAYSALNLTQDTGTLTARMVGPYEDCLRRARDVVARFQQPSLEKAFMAELSARVRQISEAHLSTVTP